MKSKSIVIFGVLLLMMSIIMPYVAMAAALGDIPLSGDNALYAIQAALCIFGFSALAVIFPLPVKSIGFRLLVAFALVGVATVIFYIHVASVAAV